MAKIYKKTISVGTDNCLILGPQEAYQADFNIGSWTSMYLAYLTSIVGLSDDNGSALTESLPDLASRYMYCGLKTNDGNLPGSTVGSNWVGLQSQTPANNNFNPSNGLINYGTSSSPYLYTSQPTVGVGTTLSSISAIDGGAPIGSTSTPGATTNYLYGRAMRITKASGSSTAIAVASVLYPSISDPTYATLRAWASNATWVNSQTISSAAITIPDSIFIYNPFIQNRLRIHAVVVEKLS